jgi:hypothetical protein
MLKAAQGRVRCGRCESVFDALTFLMEQRQASAMNEVGEIDLSEEDEADDVPESALECHLSADDLGKVFVVAPSPTLKRPVAGAPPSPLPTAGARPKPDIDDEDTAEHEILNLEGTEGADVEVITLEGETVETKDIKLDPEKPKPKAETRQEATARIDAEVRHEIETAFAADPTTRAEFTLPSGRRITLQRDEPAVEDAHEVLARSRERLRLRFSITPSRWLAGSALLGLLLVGQLVHANRQSIVRSPTFGPALGAIYASLGAELSPAWDVRAYELRQWGAAADPGASGTLRVRASLLNGADHAQPYPLLRLTLQDRFGSEVAMRALEPREYLHSEPGSNDLLGAGQRIDAEIAIVDPGKDAVGFEIDVCLRDPNGLKCANEQARHSG